jgi:xanthine dehydrogenase molybdopterin-binding subunit B
VHYHGQPLFLVAADLAPRRRAAAARAWIEIDEGLPILTIDEALAAESGSRRARASGPRAMSRRRSPRPRT